MGRTHACHGASAGFALTYAAGNLGAPVSPGLAFVIAGIGAGAAIAPDLDHPGATASRSLGWFSAVASAAVQSISANVYAATKTPRDRRNADGHRGVTHTAPGAAGLGLFFGGVVGVAGLFEPTAGTVAALVVIWLFLVWALRALPPRHTHAQDYLTASVLTAGAWYVLQDQYGGMIPVLLGLVIAVGAYVHALGDGLTEYGAPLAWPVIVKGERWYSCGSPGALRFKAGKKAENRLVFPASLVVVVALALLFVPGAYGLLGDLVARTWVVAFG